MEREYSYAVSVDGVPLSVYWDARKPQAGLRSGSLAIVFDLDTDPIILSMGTREFSSHIAEVSSAIEHAAEQIPAAYHASLRSEDEHAPSDIHERYEQLYLLAHFFEQSKEGVRFARESIVPDEETLDGCLEGLLIELDHAYVTSARAFERYRELVDGIEPTAAFYPREVE